jgi:hypothetical protein
MSLDAVALGCARVCSPFLRWVPRATCLTVKALRFSSGEATTELVRARAAARYVKEGMTGVCDASIPEKRKRGEQTELEGDRGEDGGG